MATKTVTGAPRQPTGAPAPERCGDGLESDEAAALLRDIEIAERQIADGEVIPHHLFRREVLRRLSE